MAFDAAAASALYASLESAAQSLGLFQAVEAHEPVNAPGRRLYCSIVLGPAPMRPLPAASGLAAVSGEITFTFTVWASWNQRPLENVDPEVLAAVASLMTELSGEFSLGGTVRNIDLFSMSATPGWIDFQNEQFRVMNLSVPIVINDMFAEVA